jgi:hypothetical protein
MNDTLRHFSSYIPGGVGTMIALARLSTDESVRRVALANDRITGINAARTIPTYSPLDAS